MGCKLAPESEVGAWGAGSSPCRIPPMVRQLQDQCCWSKVGSFKPRYSVSRVWRGTFQMRFVLGNNHAGSAIDGGAVMITALAWRMTSVVSCSAGEVLGVPVQIRALPRILAILSILWGFECKTFLKNVSLRRSRLSERVWIE